MPSQRRPRSPRVSLAAIALIAALGGCSSSDAGEDFGPGRAVCGDGRVEQGEACDDGNTSGGDGCSATCTLESDGGTDGDASTDGGPPETVCQALAPLASGVCAVTPGTAPGTLIQGTVLVPGRVFRGGGVLVDAQGAIACVGCDCAASAAGATTVVCPSGVVSPGLINTHDHITYAQNAPFTDTGERYEHRHEWRKGLDGHTKIPSSGSATGAQISWGELRFLFGGATSTVGSGGQAGLLRNLDKTNLEEGIAQTAVNFDTFPLDDSTPPSGFPGEVACSKFGNEVTAASIADEDAYLPHVAEGIVDYAETEFVCLGPQNPEHDVLLDKSAYIHGVGLTASDYGAMAASGTSLIWSPRSNISLYGTTAMVTTASRLGVSIALGTDWVISGSMSLLRELKCADEWNRTRLAGYFRDEQLWLMVTQNAAVATATDDVIGVLAQGKVADIAVFDGSKRDAHRAVIDAEPSDVALVLRGGRVLYGDAAAVTALAAGRSCETVDVCGVSKGLCLEDEIGRTYGALQSSLGGIYPAFFCGTPQSEPTCVPKRPAAVQGSSTYDGTTGDGDRDGDGVADAEDDCPTVFDPIRPLDHGAQPDGDGDGVGDACDPCPLVANATECTPAVADDRDGDGVSNAADDCPDVANPSQADADMDGKGDACDPCPDASNPGASACPATIYQVKDGTVPVGAQVALQNALVTARFDGGFFLQVKPGDAAYAGPERSGVLVEAPGNSVKAGDRVTVSTATVKDAGGAIVLASATTTVLASAGEAPPDPVVAAPADVATGGPRAAALEAVLVEVDDVTTTDAAPVAGPGDTQPIHEFVVDAALRVDDLLHLASPFPAANDPWASIRGVLAYRNGNSKLEPTRAADLVRKPGALVGFAPATSFVDVGASGAWTFPTALAVTLSGAMPTDTFVTVTSADPASLAVVGGGVTVPAGATTAPLVVDALAQAASVKLTATLGSTSLDASVRVLGAAEQPKLISLGPSAATIHPGGTVHFQLALDFPARAGGQPVAISLEPANAGTVPATVTVLQGDLAASFDYVDGSTVPSATVAATLGATKLTSSVTISSNGMHLVINEVDYDQVGTDSAEFVELFHAGPQPQSLTGWSLLFVNGSGSTVYKTVSLAAAGTIQPGAYLVVGSNAALQAVPAGVAKIGLGGSTDYIQNGPPDGIALVDANGAVVDALSYEGAITAAQLPGGVASLVEGTALATSVADSNTQKGSLCRLPDGVDTDDAASDWKLSSNPTPGAPNVP